MGNNQKLNKVESNPLHPFLTPDGYFEDFKMNIMEKIKEEEQIEVVPEKKKKNLLVRWTLPIAAAAAVFATVFVLNFNRPETPEKMGLLATQTGLLTEDEFEQFLYEETAEDYWGQMLLDDVDSSADTKGSN